jgi:hypothetical protein
METPKIIRHCIGEPFRSDVKSLPRSFVAKHIYNLLRYIHMQLIMVIELSGVQFGLKSNA